MALNAGNANCTTGLSKRVYDYLVADSRNGFVDPLTDAGRDAVRALCYAVGRAVVDEITANADVTITPSDSGLQRADGVETQAPLANKVLTSAIS